MSAEESSVPESKAPPPPVPLRAFGQGDMVGGYELVRYVHRGAFGQVWIGRHTILHDRCAVKVVPDNCVGRAELDGVRSYKHVADRYDGLVPIRELGAVPGKGFYYTMPLADDVCGPAIVRDTSEYEPMTLHRYCELHRPAAIDRVVSVAMQLLPSLHALHEAGLIHRDVKPGNIVRVGGTWKFCDAGLVTRRDQIVDTGAGTPHFVPREGVRDRRADLYALGVTLYLLATDHRLDEFAEFRAGRLGIPGEDGRRNALKEILRRAGEPDPVIRFQTALEMYESIRALVRTTKVTVTLDEEYATFTQARLEDFLRAVRERGFHVFGVPACAEGSVLVTMEVATDQVKELMEAVRQGAFAEFRVARAEYTSQAGVAEVSRTGERRVAEVKVKEVREETAAAAVAEVRRMSVEVMPSPIPDLGTISPVPPVPPVARVAPRLLGGYVVSEELGRGGRRVAYRAMDRLGREVALKVGLPPFNRDFDAHLQRASRFHATLDHPNIVRIFDAGTADGVEYIIEELCPGGTLADRVNQKPLSAQEAAKIVATVADAVQAIHDKGAIHRDLKPVNILFTQHGVPKLSGLGIVLLLDEQEGTIAGTPAYMAPEQAREPQNLGPPADVYGLGATLYHCLTGRPPFGGSSAFEIFHRIHDAEPAAPRTLNPAVPRDLETICLKCLAKNPAGRYPSAAELAKDLRRFLQGDELVARPRAGLEKAWHAVLKNPWRTAAVALGLVAALFGLLLVSK